MLKRKTFFIAVGIATLGQILGVFIVDLSTVAAVKRYDSMEEFQDNTKLEGPLKNAIRGYYFRNCEGVIRALCASHFSAHVVWLVTLCVSYFYVLKPTPIQRIQILPFVVGTTIVCLSDAACCSCTIYYSVVYGTWASTTYAYLFFPFFFGKIGIIWIFNIVVAIYILQLAQTPSVVITANYPDIENIPNYSAQPDWNLPPQQKT